MPAFRLLQNRGLEGGPRQADAARHFLASERAVRETDQAHEAARRIAEHMAIAAWIGARLTHGGEHGIARAQADYGGAWLGRAHADQAARIIASECQHRCTRLKPVALDEIRGKLAHARGGGHCGEQLSAPDLVLLPASSAGLQAPCFGGRAGSCLRHRRKSMGADAPVKIEAMNALTKVISAVFA